MGNEVVKEVTICLFIGSQADLPEVITAISAYRQYPILANHLIEAVN